MVSGFQDISSEDEVEHNIQNTPTPTEKPDASKTTQKGNTSFDVDIELTSEESAEEETAVTVSPVVDSDDDSHNTEKTTEPAKPLVKIVINEPRVYYIPHVSFIFVTGSYSSCSNTGSIRDDPYWTSRKNGLELIELSSTNKVSLV